MQVRRSVVAIGLSAALVGAGAGTAAAATEGAAPDEGSSGLLGGVEDTVSSLTDSLGLKDGGRDSGGSHSTVQGREGAGAGAAPGKVQAQKAEQQVRQAGEGEKAANAGISGQNGSSASAPSLPSLSDLGGQLPEMGENLPELGGKEGLLPGVCVGADLDGNAPCPNTELLGGSPLEVCFDEAQFGTQFAEQLGVKCLAKDEGKEPAPNGPPERGGEKEHHPTVKPPPRHRAQPAEPAEPVSAKPSFTG